MSVQGHAEVVQLELSDESTSEFAAFADKYFDQFVKTPFGMMRQVPSQTTIAYEMLSIVCKASIAAILPAADWWQCRKPIHVLLIAGPAGRRAGLQECHRPARRRWQPAVQGPAGALPA